MSIISQQDRDFIMERLEEAFNIGFKEAFENEAMRRWLYDLSDNDLLCDMDILFDGCTKYVFLFEDVDYVVKVSRKGLKYDYCALECENYQKAINAEVENYFAWTEFLTEIKGIKFYVQERVDCDLYDFNDDMLYYAEKIYNRSGYIDQDEELDENSVCDILWDMVDDFDEESRLNAVFGEGYETQKLVGFCSQNKINDLHQNNFGIKNDFPVIIDFSGYCG